MTIEKPNITKPPIPGHRYSPHIGKVGGSTEGAHKMNPTKSVKNPSPPKKG